MMHAQVFTDPRTLRMVQRAAPYLLAMLLALSLLARAGGSAASAKAPDLQVAAITDVGAVPVGMG